MSDESKKSSARDTILARRALYLTTALATIGCSSKSSLPPSAGASGGTPAGTGSAPVPTATASAEHVAIAPKATFEEVINKRPPIGISEGVPAREAVGLKALGARLEERYKKVGVVWRQVPACDPSAAACDPDWRKLAEDARSMYRALDGNFIGGCGGASFTTASYRLRQQAHSRYLLSLTKRIEAHLSDVAKSYSYGSERRCQLLLAKAKEKPPMPCLSPCRMPEVSDITEHVRFPKGSAALQLDDKVKPVLEQVLRAQQAHGTRAILHVRGHADASEDKPTELAAARAKAVLQWLAKQGVAAAQLRSESLGTKLPVERSGGEHAAANRRVDFLVVAAD